MGRDFRERVARRSRRVLQQGDERKQLAGWHDVYAKLLPQLGSQDHFLYLLAQMQGEIASSHTFMRRGVDTDVRKPSPA